MTLPLWLKSQRETSMPGREFPQKRLRDEPTFLILHPQECRASCRASCRGRMKEGTESILVMSSKHCSWQFWSASPVRVLI
jgi:hypothetical protein